MRPTTLLVLAALLSAALAVWMLATRATGSAHADEPERPDSTTPAAHPDRENPSERRDGTHDVSVARFLVTANGAPLPAARVVAHLRTDRSVSAEAVHELARCDADGIASVPLHELDEAAAVAVESPGWRSAILSAPFEARDYRVALQRGAVLRLRFRSADGPCEGLRVELSQGALPAPARSVERVPGAGPLPIWTGTTADDGTAEFSRLPLGEYTVRLDDGMHVPVSHRPRWTVHVEGLYEERTFDVRPLRIGLLRVTGDHVLAVSPEIAPDDVVGGESAARLERALRTRFPDAEVIVMAPREGETFSVRIEGAETGTHSARIPARAAHEPLRVTQIDLSDEPVVHDVADVLVHLVTPSGRTLPGVDLFFREAGSQARWPVRTGERQPVRLGRYEVNALHGIQKSMLAERTVTVEPGLEVIRIRLTQELVRYDLSVRAGDDVVRGTTIELRRGRWAHVLHCPYPDSVRTVIPVGRIRVTVHAPGHAQWRRSIDVEAAGDEAGTRHLAVTLDG